MAEPLSPARSEYRFGAVIVDVGQREIRVGGRAVDTQPKVFDLLHYLILHRERVVDKDELMRALWPDVVVTEASLTQALKKARRVVGDSGDHQKVIRTVQRRGFRFVADLLENGLAELESSTPRIALPTPAVQKVDPAVAVLPFVDMSPEHDQQYFCDGMAEEITNALSRIDGLRVAARSSAFAFRGTAAPLRDIARSLAVSSVVEGSVRRAGDRLRVTAQLVDAITGFQRWSERWDRPLADVFAIQDEIATQVTRALKYHLTSDDRAAIYCSRTRAIGAYDLYLRGLTFLHRFGKRSQRFALEMFHEALALEPDYAPAWAGVATSRVLLYLHSEATDEHKRLALEAGARAIELDPLSAEAHVAWATAATLRGDYRVADAAFERAQTLNPRLFEAWYFHGRSCAARGEHGRAVILYEKAARTQPEDYQALDLAVQSYRSLGRHADARHAAVRCIAAAERIVSLYPSDVHALSMCACVLPELERFEEARRWTERACALEPEESFVHYNAACTYVLLGDYERAFEHLERVGVEILADRDWIEQDSALDAVRDHPRYKTFLSRAR